VIEEQKHLINAVLKYHVYASKPEKNYILTKFSEYSCKIFKYIQKFKCNNHQKDFLSHALNSQVHCNSSSICAAGLLPSEPDFLVLG